MVRLVIHGPGRGPVLMFVSREAGLEEMLWWQPLLGLPMAPSKSATTTCRHHRLLGRPSVG
jgi:hypothetical protein